jgi:hypothetical protein
MEMEAAGCRPLRLDSGVEFVDVIWGTWRDHETAIEKITPGVVTMSIKWNQGI